MLSATTSAAGGELALQQLPHRHVQLLPQIDEHEVEGAGELLEGDQRVANTKLHVAVKTGPAQLCRGVLGLRRPQLQRSDPAADGPCALRQPLGGVAVGTAHLKDARCLALPDQQVQEHRRRPAHRQEQLVPALHHLRPGQRAHQGLFALRARLVVAHHRQERRVRGHRIFHGTLRRLLGGSGEVFLQRRHAQALGFEQALQMLA